MVSVCCDFVTCRPGLLFRVFLAVLDFGGSIFGFASLFFSSSVHQNSETFCSNIVALLIKVQISVFDAHCLYFL